jgi:hypothetical protein
MTVCSPELRVHAIHIWGDALGHDDSRGNESGKVYSLIHDHLCREYGCFQLGDDTYSTSENKLRLFLGKCDTEEALDVIEISFRFICLLLRNSNSRYSLGSSIDAEEAVEELNERFRWHVVGYQFESGFMVQVDSQFLHSQAVKPTLVLLTDELYRGSRVVGGVG